MIAVCKGLLMSIGINYLINKQSKPEEGFGGSAKDCSIIYYNKDE